MATNRRHKRETPESAAAPRTQYIRAMRPRLVQAAVELVRIGAVTRPVGSVQRSRDPEWTGELRAREEAMRLILLCSARMIAAAASAAAHRRGKPNATHPSPDDVASGSRLDLHR